MCTCWYAWKCTCVEGWCCKFCWFLTYSADLAAGLRLRTVIGFFMVVYMFKTRIWEVVMFLMNVFFTCPGGSQARGLWFFDGRNGICLILVFHTVFFRWWKCWVRFRRSHDEQHKKDKREKSKTFHFKMCPDTKNNWYVINSVILGMTLELTHYWNSRIVIGFFVCNFLIVKRTGLSCEFILSVLHAFPGEVHKI